MQQHSSGIYTPLSLRFDNLFSYRYDHETEEDEVRELDPLTHCPHLCVGVAKDLHYVEVMYLEDALDLIENVMINTRLYAAGRNVDPYGEAVGLRRDFGGVLRGALSSRFSTGEPQVIETPNGDSMYEVCCWLIFALDFLYTELEAPEAPPLTHNLHDFSFMADGCSDISIRGESASITMKQEAMSECGSERGDGISSVKSEVGSIASSANNRSPYGNASTAGNRPRWQWRPEAPFDKTVETVSDVLDLQLEIFGSTSGELGQTILVFLPGAREIDYMCDSILEAEKNEDSKHEAVIKGCPDEAVKKSEVKNDPDYHHDRGRTASNRFTPQTEASFLKTTNFEVLKVHSRSEAASAESLTTEISVSEVTGRRRKRIILATNIAESSLTIPSVGVVIDFGLCKELRYDTNIRLSSLRMQWASRAACDQRKGRTGRVQPGVCIRLMPREVFDELPHFPESELKRCQLDNVVLNIKKSFLNPKGVDQVSSYQQMAQDPYHLLSEAVDPPDAGLVRDAIITLQAIGALAHPRRPPPSPNETGDNDKVIVSGDLTPLGVVLCELPVAPILGRMVMLGFAFGCVAETTLLASLMSTDRGSFFDVAGQEAFTRWTRKVKWARGTESDLVAAISLWNAFQVEFRDHLSPSNSYGGRAGLTSHMRRWLLKEGVSVRDFDNTRTEYCTLQERLQRLGYWYDSVPLTIEADPSADPRDPRSGSRPLGPNNDLIFVLHLVVCGGVFPNIYTSSPRERTLLDKFQCGQKRVTADGVGVDIVTSLPTDTMFTSDCRSLQVEEVHDMGVSVETGLGLASGSHSQWEGTVVKTQERLNSRDIMLVCVRFKSRDLLQRALWLQHRRLFRTETPNYESKQVRWKTPAAMVFTHIQPSQHQVERSVDSTSVNSFAVEDTIKGLRNRLLIPTRVYLVRNSNIPVLAETALLPPIAGLTDLLCLIFSSEVEAVASKSVKGGFDTLRFYDQYVVNNHKMSVMLNVEDLRGIDQIRGLISARIREDGKHLARDLAHDLRRQLLHVITRPRRASRHHDADLGSRERVETHYWPIRHPDKFEWDLETLQKRSGDLYQPLMYRRNRDEAPLQSKPFRTADWSKGFVNAAVNLFKCDEVHSTLRHLTTATHQLMQHTLFDKYLRSTAPFLVCGVRGCHDVLCPISELKRVTPSGDWVSANKSFQSLYRDCQFIKRESETNETLKPIDKQLWCVVAALGADVPEWGLTKVAANRDCRETVIDGDGCESHASTVSPLDVARGGMSDYAFVIDHKIKWLAANQFNQTVGIEDISSVKNDPLPRQFYNDCLMAARQVLDAIPQSGIKFYCCPHQHIVALYAFGHPIFLPNSPVQLFLSGELQWDEYETWRLQRDARQFPHTRVPWSRAARAPLRQPDGDVTSFHLLKRAQRTATLADQYALESMRAKPPSVAKGLFDEPIKDVKCDEGDDDVCFLSREFNGARKFYRCLTCHRPRTVKHASVSLWGDLADDPKALHRKNQRQTMKEVSLPGEIGGSGGRGIEYEKANEILLLTGADLMKQISESDSSPIRSYERDRRYESGRAKAKRLKGEVALCHSELEEVGFWLTVDEMVEHLNDRTHQTNIEHIRTKLSYGDPTQGGKLRD
eukprot:GHVN01059762.1.p1 GENE.GHVN01059762.1~~GHVN01059762.1.p1  ORF type:complete len:1613 (-),score=246.54 GHVN01059762.1:1340-6178(-)